VQIYTIPKEFSNLKLISVASSQLPSFAGLISSIFRVKKSNSKSKLKFKPKRPEYGRNHGFEFNF
jgi:hypothetical protein